MLVIDVARLPQPMWIMDLVWPITALFGSLAAVWLYFRFGRPSSDLEEAGRSSAQRTDMPFAISVAKGTLHCGAGCTLGDILAELLVVAAPRVAIWFGWQTLFREKMFAVWIIDYIFAFALGIAFQYFAIKPMRGLSVGQGLVEAVKADFLSLTAWQIGMYGFMALAQFHLFGHLLGVRLEATMAEFWFMMQIAMMAGFLTSYPVNWWLLAIGVKERM